MRPDPKAVGMSKAEKRKPARRMGRPTQRQSRELDEKIVSIALELFLEHGYEGVTMDALARALGITKRTLYMRYRDKGEIFLAAFDKSKGEWKFEGLDLSSMPESSLEQKLMLLAEALLQQVLNPRYIKLGRIAVSIADNYPEQIRMSYDMSLSPRIQSVVVVLKNHKNEIDSSWCENLEMTAELFVGMITGLPARLASMGTVRDLEFEKRRVKQAVYLFVQGIKTRMPP